MENYILNGCDILFTLELDSFEYFWQENLVILEYDKPFIFYRILDLTLGCLKLSYKELFKFENLR